MLFNYTIQSKRLKRIDYYACSFIFDASSALLLDSLSRIDNVHTIMAYGIYSIDILSMFYHNIDQHIIHANLIPDIMQQPFLSTNDRKQFYVCCREDRMPFKNGMFDLGLSNLTLQYINQLELALMQYKLMLKPGGLFSASILGGHTAQELRYAFTKADYKVYGGAFARIAPMITADSILRLLQRIGFKSVIAYNDIIKVHYTSFYKLLHDMRSLGYGSILLAQQPGLLTPAVLKHAEQVYKEEFSTSNDSLDATFDIIIVSGFA